MPFSGSVLAPFSGCYQPFFPIFPAISEVVCLHCPHFKFLLPLKEMLSSLQNDYTLVVHVYMYHQPLVVGSLKIRSNILKPGNRRSRGRVFHPIPKSKAWVESGIRKEKDIGLDSSREPEEESEWWVVSVPSDQEVW
ncbi:hypothetical protein NPIL_108521 [Nephila pilipes]|uniref:Uncharacterized protein n=1 Tax=Nephila pilipes TaxID=299642 RepID=A0A8X6NWJ1_NEPPI|nr:hypothetical protein NPIL_108521 [Nephila pilipes]